MVPLDLEKLLEWIKSLKLIKRGAESEIRLGEFLGLKAIYKVRLPKPYMHPALDRRLRDQRTRKEARIMVQAYESGVPVPKPYLILPSIGLIVMEYIEGPTLKDVAQKLDHDKLTGLFEEAGEILGRLHEAGIVHGDSTTSNYIVRGGRLYLIDFGLAEFSESIEDRAVDLHLFRRAVESTHASIADLAYNSFIKGYSDVLGTASEEVVRRAEDIRLRGRYVEARRRTVWAT